MTSPTTLALPSAGCIALLSKPEYEKRKYDVNEAPLLIIRNGRVETYSASAIDANYCLGLLRAPVGADRLDAGSWTTLRASFRRPREYGVFTIIYIMRTYSSGPPGGRWLL